MTFEFGMALGLTAYMVLFILVCLFMTRKAKTLVPVSAAVLVCLLLSAFMAYIGGYPIIGVGFSIVFAVAIWAFAYIGTLGNDKPQWNEEEPALDTEPEPRGAHVIKTIQPPQDPRKRGDVAYLARPRFMLPAADVIDIQEAS